MSTKKLLNGLIGLRDELVEQRQSQHWDVQRKILVTLLKAYRVQLEYEEAKTKYDVHIPFLETGKPLSEKKLNNIKEAYAVNQQISKHLSDLKKRK